MRVFKILPKDLQVGDYLKDSISFRKVLNIEGTIVSLAGEGVAFDLKGKRSIEILDVLSYQASKQPVPAWKSGRRPSKQVPAQFIRGRSAAMS